MIEFHFEEMQAIASQKFNLNDISSAFLRDFIYNSLSFEKDNIAPEDVEAVLREEAGGMEEEKFRLIKNHVNAFWFVVDMVKNGVEMDENKLKDLHEVLMDGLDIGGLYRRVDISIKGSNHTPPSHLKVYDRMKSYFANLEDEGMAPLEKIAYSHVQLAKIHPFLDGNGRLARLVLDYHLMKNGLAPIVIPYNERLRYFDALETYKVNKDIAPFIQYLIEKEKETLGL